MDDATRHAVLQILGNAMSDISEESYCAGWATGTEYIVPELCRRALDSGQPERWGRWEVTPETARGLTHLAGELGCWATLNDSGTGYVPHQPFPVPAVYLAALDGAPS